MKKVLLAAALVLAPALSFSGKAMAAQTPQVAQTGTEICVNASNAEQARRQFPNARIHVLPNMPDPDMNGWTHVSGIVRPDGSIHTDAEAIAHMRKRVRISPAE